MDLLADLLATSGVHGTLGARIDGAADWGWWAPATDRAAFHAVTSGTAWYRIGGDEPVELVPGDVLLLRDGREHALGSDREAVMRTSATRFDMYEQDGGGVVRIGSGAVRTHILCAHYAHDPVASSAVLDPLPAVVHLRADGGGRRLDDTVRLLARELAAPEMATTLVLDRLVDVLLVQLLRAWLADAPQDGPPSWAGALRDPVVGAALARIHAEPERDWTTGTLAREVAVSRATLARRFPAALGETPGAYLTRRRMDLAARRLRDSDDTLEQISRAVGYASPYAFSRAFRRARGTPPGRFRARSREERSRG